MSNVLQKLKQLVNVLLAVLILPIFALLFAFALLPWGSQLRAIGVIAAYLPIRRKTIISKNLQFCFAEASAQQISQWTQLNSIYSLAILPSMIMAALRRHNVPRRAFEYPCEVTGFTTYSNHYGCTARLLIASVPIPPTLP